MIGDALDGVARAERPILVSAFLAAGLAICLFLSFAVPVGQVPDEIAHAMRADSVRHGVVVGQRWTSEAVTLPWQPGWGGVDAGVDDDGVRMMRIPAQQRAGAVADHGLVRSAQTFGQMTLADRVTPAGLAQARATPWTGPLQADFRNTVQYPPILYAGAALGIGLAQQAGFGPYDAMIGARLVNVAQFLAVGALALWLAVAGRLTLFVVLTLPMTLFLSASVSQDGLMIAVAALAAAMTSRLWQKSAPPAWRIALLGLVLAVVITARPSNAPLALLLVLPMPGVAWRPRLIAFAAVTLVTLGWSALIAIKVSVPISLDANAGGQLALIRANPWLLWQATSAALDAYWRDYLEQMVGWLGILDIHLPRWALILYLLPVAAAVLGDLVQPATGPRLRLAAALAIILGGAFLAALSQFLTWTPVGGTRIDGVQGRYFLPLAVVVGIGLAGLLPRGPRWRGLAVLIVLTALPLSAIVLPAVLMARYYGP